MMFQYNSTSGDTTGSNSSNIPTTTTTNDAILEQQRLKQREMLYMNDMPAYANTNANANANANTNANTNVNTPANASALGKDFISAPEEYSNRARDEIKKRLMSGSGMGTMDDIGRNSRRRQSITASTSTSSSTNSTSDSGSSIFSNQYSYASSNGSNIIPNDYYSTSKQQQQLQVQQPLVLSLEDALPQNFHDYYFYHDLQYQSQAIEYLSNGRPSFSKRDLLDWDLNDIRSLLIYDSVKPEWNNQIPQIRFNTQIDQQQPQFHVVILPLNSTDDFIVKTLVESDLYLEHTLDYDFKMMNAQFTVQNARKKYLQYLNDHKINYNERQPMYLSKPEWRSIIDNYLLNIAVEAQCRFDFKKKCKDYKKWKASMSPVMAPPPPPPSSSSTTTASNNNKSLLRKTLLKNSIKASKLSPILETSGDQVDDVDMNDDNNNSNMDNQHVSKIKESKKSKGKSINISKEEKSILWQQVQREVYQRLKLDWQPDTL